jgi:hypothetical protein
MERLMARGRASDDIRPNWLFYFLEVGRVEPAKAFWATGLHAAVASLFAGRRAGGDAAKLFGGFGAWAAKSFCADLGVGR